jgi:thymidylate synthase
VTAASSAEAAWRGAVARVVAEGSPADPRGMPTLEVWGGPHVAVVDMRRPLVTSPVRRVKVELAAAEALWVLAGDDLLEPLVRHAPSYANFSDDGVRLAGAYGPRIAAQRDYVVGALLRDRTTRQAVLTTWERCPGPSRDVPCTVSLTYAVRGGALCCHACMRSSDVWLGVPYDVFTFSMVAARIACDLNLHLPAGERVGLGRLVLTATSSHLYEVNRGRADEVLASPAGPDSPELPDDLVRGARWHEVQDELLRLREGEPRLLWQVTP